MMLKPLALIISVNSLWGITACANQNLATLATAVPSATTTLIACHEQSATRTEAGNIYEPHIFRVRADGTAITQLETRPFPQDRVRGAHFLHWSKNAEWLELSLWDGTADGCHYYRIRTDGSGEFEILPLARKSN